MSQTDSNGKARPYYAVGRDTFDHPDWDGQTLEGIGLWSFLQAEACRTTGRRITLMTAYKAAGFSSRERIKEVFESLVASGQLTADDEPTRYRIAGWDKHQEDLTKYKHPSDRPEETRARKAKSRAVAAALSRGHEPLSRVVTRESRKIEIETTPTESLSPSPSGAAAEIDESTPEQRKAAFGLAMAKNGIKAEIASGKPTVKPKAADVLTDTPGVV